MDDPVVEIITRVMTSSTAAIAFVYIAAGAAGIFYFAFTKAKDSVNTTQTIVLSCVTFFAMLLWFLAFALSCTLLFRWAIQKPYTLLEWCMLTLYLLPIIVLVVNYVFLRRLYYERFNLVPEGDFVDSSLAHEVNRYAREFHITPPAIRYYNSDFRLPRVAGVFFGRKTLMLPKKLIGMNDSQKEFVIRHELAHIRNRDVPMVAISEQLYFSAKYWMPILLLNLILSVAFIEVIDKFLFLAAVIVPFFILFSVLFRLIYLWVSKYREFLADFRAYEAMDVCSRARIYLRDLLDGIEYRQRISVRDGIQRSRVFRKDSWTKLLGRLKKSAPGLHKYLFPTHPDPKEREKAIRIGSYSGMNEPHLPLEVTVLVGMLVGLASSTVFFWMSFTSGIILSSSFHVDPNFITFLIRLFQILFGIGIGVTFSMPLHHISASDLEVLAYYKGLAIRFFFSITSAIFVFLLFLILLYPFSILEGVFLVDAFFVNVSYQGVVEWCWESITPTFLVGFTFPLLCSSVFLTSKFWVKYLSSAQAAIHTFSWALGCVLGLVLSFFVILGLSPDSRFSEVLIGMFIADILLNDTGLMKRIFEIEVLDEAYRFVLPGRSIFVRRFTDGQFNRLLAIASLFLIHG